ncbi:MAG: carboxypeptidase regulatory-like domain-containing protein [Candidatus Krumholzibacteriia bacterium]
MQKAVRIACAVLLTAFLGAGCGGGGDTSDQSSGTTTEDSSTQSSGQRVGSSTAAGASATLWGKIDLAGTPPERSKVKMSGDPVCAQQHEDMPVLVQSVIANDQGMLKNVFVYVKNGLEGEEFDVPEAPVVLDQKGCMYAPHVMGMMVKQDLKIINSDPTLHNIHAVPTVKGNREFNIGMPRQGMEFTKTFPKPEVMVRIKCDVHPWMASYIGVLTHPYYAVTGDDGSFEITGLPPGEYTIEAWHEKYGTQTRTITVGDSPQVEANFTFQVEGS